MQFYAIKWNHTLNFKLFWAGQLITSHDTYYRLWWYQQHRASMRLVLLSWCRQPPLIHSPSMFGKIQRKTYRFEGENMKNIKRESLVSIEHLPCAISLVFERAQGWAATRPRVEDCDEDWRRFQAQDHSINRKGRGEGIHSVFLSF